MPPPPPPGPPKSCLQKGQEPVERDALLKSIQKGAALKKTVTNDRSAPIIDGSNNSSPKGGSAATIGQANGFTGIGNIMFPGGPPKLRPTAGAGTSIFPRNDPITPEKVNGIVSSSSSSFLHKSAPSSPLLNSNVSGLKKNFPSDVPGRGPAPQPPSSVFKPNVNLPGPYSTATLGKQLGRSANPNAPLAPSKPQVLNINYAAHRMPGQRAHMPGKPPPNVKPPPPPKTAAPNGPPSLPDRPPSNRPSLRRLSLNEHDLRQGSISRPNSGVYSPSTPANSGPGSPGGSTLSLRNISSVPFTNQVQNNAIRMASSGPLPSSKLGPAPQPPQKFSPPALRPVTRPPPPPNKSMAPPPPSATLVLTSHSTLNSVPPSPPQRAIPSAPPPPPRNLSAKALPPVPVSSDKSRGEEFESRFYHMFRRPAEFPRPDVFTRCDKTYFSEKHKNKRQPPPPPPGGSNHIQYQIGSKLYPNTVTEC